MSYFSEYDHIEGRGRGYDYAAGMSNNAVDAYDRGVKPLTRLTLGDLKDSGWSQTKAFAVFLAESGFWCSTEWHHSGGTWYNKVAFFDPSNLVNKWLGTSQLDREKWQEKYQESRNTKHKPNQESAGVKVSGRYTIWGGTRRRPKRLGEQKFTGLMKGNWIFLDCGGKKKADGRHITWRKA